VNIINSGISGDSAIGGAERLERDVLAYNPDLCVVSYGLNDSGRGEEGIEIYKERLESIFSRLADKGIEIIFLSENSMYIIKLFTKESNGLTS
jgi:lysophospholipase L1-like esterase